MILSCVKLRDFGGWKATPGNTFSLTIEFTDAAEHEKVWQALAESGKILMPLQDTFWGAHMGSLVDRLGVQWMLNYNKPK
jgi:PhnB protein